MDPETLRYRSAMPLARAARIWLLVMFAGIAGCAWLSESKFAERDVSLALWIAGLAWSIGSISTCVVITRWGRRMRSNARVLALFEVPFREPEVLLLALGAVFPSVALGTFIAVGSDAAAQDREAERLGLLDFAVSRVS